MSEATTGRRAGECAREHHAEALAAERRSDEQPSRVSSSSRKGRPGRGSRATSIPSSDTRSASGAAARDSGSAPTMRSRRAGRRWISGQARSSTGSPLRGSCRPTNTMRCSRPPGSASSRDEDAVRDDLVVAREPALADSRAISETAIRRSIRSTRKPQTGIGELHPAEVAATRGTWRRPARAYERERRDAGSPASSARAGAGRRSAPARDVRRIRESRAG